MQDLAAQKAPVVPLQSKSQLPHESVLPIVGIGASAGGLEVLRQLLGYLPTDTGLAFIIVQHLDPTHESTLPDILARVTQMPVLHVKDGIAIRPNHIYVAPPNATLHMEEESIRLIPRQETGGLHMPIDLFFRSLAQSHGNRAIGMILSGSGSDGALGLEEIKENGGITFVQEPKTAQFTGMPHSAISASSIDFVLPPADIAQELTRIAAHPYVNSQPVPVNREAPDPFSQDHLGAILKLLRGAMHVDFNYYKYNTIQRRITRRMTLKRMETLEAYGAYLKQNPDELKALYHDLLIKVTGFFRDTGTFEALQKTVIPRILKQHPTDKTIRIWVAGCASGEETYSIAMCFLECMGENADGRSIRIFATDIDETALQKARHGSYLENIASDVSPERLKRFFKKIGNTYCIHKSIREMCTFARHDLCKDPPFSNLNLISCRNVMIYFTPFLQKRIIPIFHYALNPGGFLMLGTAETIGGFSELFGTEDKKQKIYVQKAGSVHPSVNFAASEFRTEEAAKIPDGDRPMDESLWRDVDVHDVYKEADRVLLSQYAPAGVLINEQMDILQFRGDTGRYLSASPGKPSFHLLNMTREGLLSGLQDAIERARQTGVPSFAEGLPVQHEGNFLSVNLKVIPIKLPPLLSQNFIVLFEEPALNSIRLAARKTRPGILRRGLASLRGFLEGAPPAPSDSAVREKDHLKQELQATKHYLQSIIENQDAANEELKSANEEILSSNEELHSTNEELETAQEELQSTNEELITVNEELHTRNVELGHANNDLNNFFASSNLPLVIVGRDLRVRQCTRIASKTLNILPTDIGRPLAELRLNIPVTDLDALLSSVLGTEAVIEREVQDQNGCWYSMRILPYKTTENKVDGVVVLFISLESIKNIEKLTRSLEEVKIAKNYSDGIVQTVREPLIILDAGLRVIQANPAFYKVFQVSKEETERQFIYSLGDNQWDIPELRRLLEEILPQNAEFKDFEVKQNFPRLGHKTMLLNAKRIVLDGTGTRTILLAIEDITERKLAEEHIKASLKEKSLLLEEVHHRVKNNLQIVSSLLKLTPDSLVDPQALKFLKESQDRIRSIALVHEKLYTSGNLSEINMAAYIGGLVERLLQSYAGSEKIQFELRAEGIFLEADLAFLCGLILTELVSNIFKHAFPGKKQGLMRIELKAEAGHRFILSVQDNGVGMPLGVNIAQTNSFGLHLVAQLVDQLGGNWDLDRSSGGTAFTIRFSSQTLEGNDIPVKQ